MRVLIVLNRGGVAGGHVVQATKTAAAVRSCGVEVTLEEDGTVDCRGFDVVHSFGASRETLRQARTTGAAVVVSPIWVSADYRRMHSRSSVTRLREAERLVRLSHSVIRRGFDETARRLREPLREKALSFELADLLLPNSQLEANQIYSDLGVTTPMHVVPNAIDEGVFTPPARDAERSGVACVGRIEPHKNQLGLIRALKGTGIPLTVAGPEHPHHPAYSKRCRQVGEGSVTFLPAGTQEAMADIYRAASVHALPSWFETTGLASLEAAASGCAVVTTSRGYAREYFNDHVTYCDPGRKGSIRSAIHRALELGPSPLLRQQVLAKYTWANAAAATLAGYRIAMESRSPFGGHT